MKITWKTTAVITAIIMFASLILLYPQYNSSFLTASSGQNESYPVFPVLVIDAGHGGEDGGAVADGIEEKDINLAFSMQLRDLSQLFGVDTVMIRETDCDLGEHLPTVRQRKVSDIKKRTQIADETPHAVYIGIHQNFYDGSSSANGLQVFYANESNDSKAIATAIQNYTAHFLQTENNREVKNSGSSIYILSHTIQPAVMVECGFMSNAEELALLCTKTYQTSVSFCIFMGLLNFYTTEVEL